MTENLLNSKSKGLEKEVQDSTTNTSDEYVYTLFVRHPEGVHVGSAMKISKTLSQHYQKDPGGLRFKLKRRTRESHGKALLNPTLEGPFSINPANILGEGIESGSELYLHSQKPLPEEVIKKLQEILEYGSLF